ncbi:MAG: hypothetical protein ACM3ON_03370 [Chloroflexota bacterium]
MRYMTVSISLLVLTAALGTATSVNGAMSKETIRAEWPEMDFTMAYDSFSKGDMRTTADEIRKGSQFFKRAEERSSGKIRNDLEGSYQELQKLSAGIEQGTVKSPKQLKRTFAHAHLALAEYYRKRLEESWLAKETERAGHDLDAAARNLERGLGWMGQQVKKETSTAIKDAHAISRKLIEGLRWASQEVEKGIKEIGAEISILRKRMEKGENE